MDCRRSSPFPVFLIVLIFAWTNALAEPVVEFTEIWGTLTLRAGKAMDYTVYTSGRSLNCIILMMCIYFDFLTFEFPP